MQLQIESLRIQRHSTWLGVDSWGEKWAVQVVTWANPALPLQGVVDVTGTGRTFEAALGDLAGKVFKLGLAEGQQWKNARLEELLEQARGSVDSVQRECEELREEVRRLQRIVAAEFDGSAVRNPG